MVRVQFVFGLGSRYSYLASTQLDAIGTRTGCAFDWVPVSSVALMEARGRSPFAGDPSSGQYEWGYRRRDAEDWASFYGVPFVEPLPPPQDHALMALATRAAGRQGALERYARALFGEVFVRHAAIDEAACAALAAGMGLDERAFRESLADPALRAGMDADIADCVARGAFGVPTFFAGGRMFWGNDRLVLLEDWLGRAA